MVSSEVEMPVPFHLNAYGLASFEVVRGFLLGLSFFFPALLINGGQGTAITYEQEAPPPAWCIDVVWASKADLQSKHIGI